MKLKMGLDRSVSHVHTASSTRHHKRRRAEVRAQKAAHRNAAYWAQFEQSGPRPSLGARILSWLCPDKS